MPKYDAFLDLNYCVSELYRLMAYVGCEESFDATDVTLDELLSSSATYFDLNEQPMQSLSSVDQRQALRKKYRWNQSARKFIYQRDLVKAWMAENV